MQGIKFIPQPKRAAVFLDKRSEKRRDFCLKKKTKKKQDSRTEQKRSVELCSVFSDHENEKHAHSLFSTVLILLFVVFNPINSFPFPLK
jgi:hypothetical protein